MYSYVLSEGKDNSPDHCYGPVIGHFDRINFLKLFPEVNLRDISKNI